MAMEITKKNGHLNLKEKYSELRDALENAALHNKKAVDRFRKMAENAAHESG